MIVTDGNFWHQLPDYIRPRLSWFGKTKIVRISGPNEPGCPD